MECLYLQRPIGLLCSLSCFFLIHPSFGKLSVPVHTCLSFVLHLVAMLGFIRANTLMQQGTVLLCTYLYDTVHLLQLPILYSFHQAPLKATQPCTSMFSHTLPSVVLLAVRLLSAFGCCLHKTHTYSFAILNGSTCSVRPSFPLVILLSAPSSRTRTETSSRASFPFPIRRAAILRCGQVCHTAQLLLAEGSFTVLYLQIFYITLTFYCSMITFKSLFVFNKKSNLIFEFKLIIC